MKLELKKLENGNLGVEIPDQTEELKTLLQKLNDSLVHPVAEMEAPEKAELQELRGFKKGIEEAFGSPESFCELAARLGFETCLPRATQVEVAVAEKDKDAEGSDDEPEEMKSEVESLAKFLSGDEV